MAKLTRKELELYGFTDVQWEYINQSNISLENCENIDSLMQELNKQIAEQRDAFKKQESEYNKMEDGLGDKLKEIREEKNPQKEYRDAVFEYGQYVIKNGLEFDPKVWDIPKRGHILSDKQMEELEDTLAIGPRDPNFEEKSRALIEKAEKLRERTIAHDGRYYMDDKREEREKEVRASLHDAKEELKDSKASLQVSEQLFASISDRVKEGYDKDVVANTLVKAEEKYNKINPFARFFSHFLPNSLTEAGRARNEVNYYKEKANEAGLTSDYIDSIRNMRKEFDKVENSDEYEKEVVVEKHTIAQLERDTKELNNKAEYVIEDETTHERAIEFADEIEQ